MPGAADPSGGFVRPARLRAQVRAGQRTVTAHGTPGIRKTAMIPSKKQERLDWLSDHLLLWSDVSAQIGLSAEEVAQLQTLYDSANSSWNTAKSSRIAARNNTFTANTAWSAMNSFLGAMVKAIRSHAQATGDDSVYAKAGLQPPAPPTPKPTPGIPTDVTTRVDNIGRIVLKWKSANSAPSSGAAFQIRRKLAGQSKYKVIATVQSRQFTDDSIPTGTSSATYIIKGFRGNNAGEPSEPVVVYLHSIETGEEGGLALAA
jgi:hypothetical protein